MNSCDNVRLSCVLVSAEMAVDSPVLPIMPSYINDLVSQIEKLQLEKMELGRTTVPAAATQEKSPSKGKRKEVESAKKQLSIASRENRSLKEQLESSSMENESLKKQADANAKEFESLQMQCDVASSEIESLKMRLHVTTKEVEEIESLKEQLKATTTENMEMKEEICQLNMTLVSCSHSPFYAKLFNKLPSYSTWKRYPM